MDAHAHLEAPAFAEDVASVVQRAEDTGVKAIITAGSDLTSSRRAVFIAETYDSVYAVVGFHPHEARKMGQGDLEALREMSANPKVVAIGEIGLDYYRNLSPREMQLAAFRQQLSLAADLGLPVVVHAREAEAEVEEELTIWARASGNRPRRALLHCFSGDLTQAQRYAELGFVVSLAGPLTYPGNERLLQVARALPLTSLAIETDAPYLPPQVYRGQRNEPAYVSLTAERLATERGVSLAAVAETTSTNVAALFGIQLAVAF